MSNLDTISMIPASVADPIRLETLERYGILDTPAEEGFDDIVDLASKLCDAPVALVSLVAADRQWFKARVGFPPCETDLNSSVCAHALGEPDLLIIPDLTADTRTLNNPLVTGAPHIRFYAGAPLRTQEGQVLGSLCVIDNVPRPAGLTPRQQEGLLALARQVRSQLELRRLLRERDRLVERQHETGTLLREQGQLLQTITDHVGQAVFQLDERGVITFANPAASAMFGYSQVELLGQSLHELLHHSHPDGSPFPAAECVLKQALERGQLLADTQQVFFRKDGMPCDVLLTLAPVLAADTITGAVLTVADVTARRVAERRLADSEAYWRGLFERLREGMVIGEVVRDARGQIADWRYLEVNPAWSELLGLPAETAVGRTIREFLPDVEEQWIDDVALAVESGEPVTFTRQVAQLDRWYEGRVSRLGPDTFIILFLNVTDRVLVEQALALSIRRKAALAHLGDTLRATLDADAIGYTAASITGKALGAAQAGYAAMDAMLETVMIGPTWCAPGVQSIAGLHHFRDYGSYVDDLKAGRAAIVPNVHSDPRTRDQVTSLTAIGVAAFINLPIVEQGQLVAVFFVTFAEPRTLTKEEVDFIHAAADRTRASIARVRAEEQQAILNAEISHRLKNTMALVQALASQTLRGVEDREAVKNFEQRLMALSTAHDVLLQKDWQSADLGEVIQQVLNTAGAVDRYTAEGPAVPMGARATLSTSLLMHELATNATKYGALTVDGGKIDVRWYVKDEPGVEELVLDWREVGGPPATAPTRKGFGSRLLSMGLVGTGGSDVRYQSTGLEATFRAPRKHVEDA